MISLYLKIKRILRRLHLPVFRMSYSFIMLSFLNFFQGFIFILDGVSLPVGFVFLLNGICFLVLYFSSNPDYN